ncbi:amiloride-sensitive sodium channel subunit beta-2-like [Leptopilina boulardi]|uniref:amiloride-sensitive sodium channel subunit beta-2-like n=1 Tax=Leptopilina boulardi TaxID=63433 RepID=UPI0021F59F8B|nr:amiloride-sensitive sodium channel subunit beta-2-like [Leptopilina boulardi]
MVDIDVEEDMYYGSTRDFAGAAVMIHESHDFPETDIVTATIQPDQQTNIAVSATQIKSLDEIRIYSPFDRTCIFEDEFNFEYSYQSCVAGCKMIRYLQICNCIPYYYPDTCMNISRTCDIKDITCIKQNIDLLTKLYEDTKIKGVFIPKCNCQQTCNKTTYSIMVDKNRLNHPRYFLPWKS